MTIPERERSALLRLAQFESERLEQADDGTIMMVQLALYKLAERQPERVAKIIALALAIYDNGRPAQPAEKSSA